MRGVLLIILMTALAMWSPTSARDLRIGQMAMTAAMGAAEGQGAHGALAPCHENQTARGLDAACCAVCAGVPAPAGPMLATAERLFTPIGPAQLQPGCETLPVIPPPKA